ncbi:MAG: phage portal protein [Pseudomonadota bacterium]
MGIFDLFRRETRAVESLTGNANPYGDGWSVAAATIPHESHPAVQACVFAIANTIASLPATIKRRDEDGRFVDAPEHPLNDWMTHGPNERESWPDFAEAVISDALLRGNGLAEIEANGDGRATGLRFIPWRNVSPMQTQSDRIAMDFTRPAIGNAAAALQRRLMPGEYLHLKDRSDDGLLGVARLSRARQALANAVGTDQHLGSLLANNGGRPGSILETDEKLDNDVIVRLKESIERYRSMEGRGKTIVLESGLKWRDIEAFSLSDMEMVEAMKFHTVTVSRLFQIPPPIISALENASYSNASQLMRFFAQTTLTAWSNKFEAAFNRAVLTAEERGTYSLSIDLAGLLRGDPETRWEAYRIGLENGVLDPKTVAKIEGYPEPTVAPPARARQDA